MFHTKLKTQEGVNAPPTGDAHSYFCIDSGLELSQIYTISMYKLYNLSLT